MLNPDLRGLGNTWVEFLSSTTNQAHHTLQVLICRRKQMVFAMLHSSWDSARGGRL